MRKATSRKQIPVEILTLDPEWTCSEAAGRIAAVLAMLNEVENDQDPDGWTLRSAIEALHKIQTTLQASIAQSAAERKGCIE